MMNDTRLTIDKSFTHPEPKKFTQCLAIICAGDYGYPADVIEENPNSFIFEMKNLPRKPEGYRARFTTGPLMDSYDL